MKQVLLILVSVLFFSCGQSKLSKELGCEKTSFSNLETVEDVHKNFSVKLPDNWKTNLYFDNSQSSIYSADTTKQLIETYLVDITMISSKIDFDNPFILDYKNQLTKNNLVESTSFQTTFLDQESYYSRALGKKNGFPYEIINLFIKVNNQAHIHAKAEVYGDSLSNERLCEAISLIEKINIKK